MKLLSKFCAQIIIANSILVSFPLTALADSKPRIAVFSGSSATIQNTAPLVTSNKARYKYALPLLKDGDGEILAHDHLVPQRLAGSVEVFIEAFSAHPLEKDAVDLYAEPDGYLDGDGNFTKKRNHAADKPVYRATLKPEDGLYLLPYMARQANGNPWKGDCVFSGAPQEQCRQPFFPDASRLFEEIDRSLAGVSSDGTGSMLSSRAEFKFIRALPSGGYKRGLPEAERTDVGTGDIAPESPGEDFFVYRPSHLRTSTRYEDLATITNSVQQALSSGDYNGAIWLEGSPTLEETIYWLNLVIDTTVPLIASAAGRYNRTVSADGAGNIVDAVDYIISGIWRNQNGKNKLGAVMIQDEQIFAARQVQKSDDRPGGYIATGDHGGIVGTMGAPSKPYIYFRPTTKHTWLSDLRVTKLPKSVNGVVRQGEKSTVIRIHTKNDSGLLVGRTIPKVSIVKAGYYSQDDNRADPKQEVDIFALINKNLSKNPLAGFVAEGLAPYGKLPVSIENALEIAVFSGMPVVFTGRGNAGGVTPAVDHEARFPALSGNNLTATKARILLTACLLKFGALPPAQPTATEYEAVLSLLETYQEIFDTH